MISKLTHHAAISTVIQSGLDNPAMTVLETIQSKNRLDQITNEYEQMLKDSIKENQKRLIEKYGDLVFDASLECGKTETLTQTDRLVF